LSTNKTAEKADTTKVVAVKPFHEVDGVVLKVGHPYDIPTEIVGGLLASGAVKEA
jgi:hypothetical protein